MLTQLIVAALATWAVVETFHHGSIFEEARAYHEVRGGFLDRMLGCPFCLSHWVALFFTILALRPHTITLDKCYVFLPLWFATIRLSNLLNDITYKITRTPGRTPQEGGDNIA